MAHGVILGQTPNTNNLLPLDGSRAMTGSLNMGNHKITNVANGTNANDAVNFNQLNTSTIQASRISGVLGTSNIPNLAASKITSGTFDTSRIPNLDASKITSGQFNTDRIPNLSASKITSGVLSVANGGTGVNNLEDLGSNFIRKTTLNVDGSMSFFGDNGTRDLPFLLKASPSSALSIEYGGTTSYIFNDNNYSYYVPLCYQSIAYGSRNYPSLLMPIGNVWNFVQLSSNSAGRISVAWEWSGNGTITFYSFV